jgi:4-hydroxyphenylpyruvate dioxygenase-like putative hemolysin
VKIAMALEVEDTETALTEVEQKSAQGLLDSRNVGRADLLDIPVIASFDNSISSYIHKTRASSMTFDVHQSHRILQLAKHLHEREDSIKVDDVAGSGVNALPHLCNISSSTSLSMTTSSGACGCFTVHSLG